MGLIASKIRKAGNSYVVTIPADEMKVRDPVQVDIRPAVRPAVREAIDRVVEENAAGLRYLAGR